MISVILAVVLLVLGAMNYVNERKQIASILLIIGVTLLLAKVLP